MKNISILKTTSTLAIAAGLLVAPLATAGSYDKSDNQTHASQKSHAERGDLMVNVGGILMSVGELDGTNVVNRQGENLGEIEDVVYSSNGEKATHLIVSTDNWFDGRTALIPVRSLEQADESTRDSFFETLRGGIVVLDMAENRFDTIATFERGADLEEYLDEKSSEIADALDLKESDIFDKNQSYRAAITNRSKEGRAENRNSKDYTAWENQDSQKYRYSSDESNWKNREVNIENKSIKASELMGVGVVNYNNERLGKVVDIIVDDKGKKADYIVVRTDDWFDGEHAVVPLKSIKYHADTQEPHPDDGANWWTGDHVVLDISEDQFEELADYRREEDPNTYIKDNRDRIRDSYHLNYSAIPVTGTYYTFAYSIPYTTANYDNNDNSSPDRHNSEQAKGESNKPNKDQMVQLGNKSVMLRELKGKTVKAKDGKKVATVSDIVADANSGEAEFLVLESSQNSRKRIVPISSVESSTKEKDHDHKGNTCATWDGKGLTLSEKSSEFTSWATFESSDEFDSFLDRSADQLSDAFGIDEDEITNSDKDYVFVFEPNGFRTASR